MQNPRMKYLKTAAGYFAVFYMEQNRIFCRRETIEGWQQPKCIVEGAMAFSLCTYEGYTYLLYPTTDGRLLLSASADLLRWDIRTLWNEGGRQWQQDGCFMIPKQDMLHLIYPQKDEVNGSTVLQYAVFQKGQWQMPYRMEGILTLPGTPFLARRLGENHVILYYRSQRNTISARELLLSPFTLGSVVPLIQTNGQCLDFSILEDTQRLHILYVVRTLFGTQVVYRYKEGSTPSRPIVLWEGNNCDVCLLYRDQGCVTMLWSAGGQPIRCRCENGLPGKPEKCRFPFPMQCCKGELICVGENDFGAEIIGDRQNGYLPMRLKEEKKEIPPMMEQSKDVAELHAASVPYMREAEQEEVIELRELLAQRSEEITQINAKWKAQVDALQAQIAVYQKQSSIQQQKNQLSATKETPEHTTEEQTETE